MNRLWFVGIWLASAALTGETALSESPASNPSSTGSISHWGAAANGFRLGCETESQGYLQRQDVPLKILLQNVTDHERQVFSVYKQPNFYQIEVRKGTFQVPLTHRGRNQHNSRDAVGVTLIKVPARGTVEATLKLNEWFEMEEPGVYEVKISGRIADAAPNGPVVQLETARMRIIIRPD